MPADSNALAKGAGAKRRRLGFPRFNIPFNELKSFLAKPAGTSESLVNILDVDHQSAIGFGCWQPAGRSLSLELFAGLRTGSLHYIAVRRQSICCSVHTSMLLSLLLPPQA